MEFESDEIPTGFVSRLGLFLARFCTSVSFPKSRRIGSLILLALVMAVMVIDYVLIYQPLLGMVIPPGQAKPAIFASYHDASKWINLAGLALCLIATTLINWPLSSFRNETTRKNIGES
jgi:ABC-type Fe3+ transport system permease subunit